jgi:hypothetical protein
VVYPETFLANEGECCIFEDKLVTGPHVFWSFTDFTWTNTPVPFSTEEGVVPEAIAQAQETAVQTTPEEAFEVMDEPPGYEEEPGYVEPDGLEDDDEAPPGPAGPRTKRPRPNSPPAITIGISALQEAAEALAVLMSDSTFLAA